MNTDIRLDKITRESRHTQDLRHLLQNRFACATCTDFVARKNRTALNFATTFRNLPQPGLLRDRSDSQAVQRAASLFNSFCSNFAKQVALFCSPFYCSFMQWDLFWPERKRGASLMQRTAHPVSLLAGDKSVSSFEAYLKTTTLKTWCVAWRSLPADHDSTWRKWTYFTNEWMTGTLSRSDCTFNLNRAVQSIKLHQCRYLPFIGLIITQRLRNKRRLSNEYTL